jgi:hypothetical protein
MHSTVNAEILRVRIGESEGMDNAARKLTVTFELRRGCAENGSGAKAENKIADGPGRKFGVPRFG